MICKQCGAQNMDSDSSCKNCGAQLNPSTQPAVRRPRTGLIVGLITAGVVLIAAAVVLVLVLGGGSSLSGPWHNEDLCQLLRFHEDETVVIRTPYGDFEAVYVFDKGSGKGVITLNGEAINFSLEGDSLLLSWGDVETAFVRGDMEVLPVIAEATPAATPAPETTATLAAKPTPTPTPTATPAPTATPTAVPTATPVDESAPSWSFGVFPSISLGPIATLPPGTSFGVIIPGDIFGGVVGNSIVGDWYYTQDDAYVLTFDSEGGCALSNAGFGIAGSYTYNKITAVGEIDIMGSPIPFSVSGDTLTWEDGSGNTFVRG